MRTARFTESTHNHRIGGLKKPQRGGNTRLISQFGIHRRKFVESLAFPAQDEHREAQSLDLSLGECHFVAMAEGQAVYH